MINTLRALVEKVDNMQEQTGNTGRGMETLRKKLKINARNQKHCKRNKKCL